jgi:hypothetical protein
VEDELEDEELDLRSRCRDRDMFRAMMWNEYGREGVVNGQEESQEGGR